MFWSVIAGTADGHIITLELHASSANRWTNKPALIASNSTCIGDGEVSIVPFDQQELRRTQQSVCTNVVIAFCDSSAIILDLSNSPCEQDGLMNWEHLHGAAESITKSCQTGRILHVGFRAKAVAMLSLASGGNAVLAFVSNAGQ